MQLKSIFSVLILVGVAVCQEMHEKMCSESLKLDRENIIMISRQTDTPIQNEIFGKYYLCVWRSRGILTANDDIGKDKVEEFVSQVFFHSLVSSEDKAKVLNDVDKSCLSIKESTSEKTALKLKNCLIGIIQQNEILKPPTL